MPIFEIIESGTVRETVPVDRPVFRIGSDPQSTIRLQSGDSHALTVIAREGKVRLINRTNRPLSLAGSELVPNVSQPWMPGQPVQLSDHMSLQFHEVRRDAHRRNRQQSASQDPLDSAAHDAAQESELKALKKKKDRKHAVTLVTTTVLLMVLFLGFSSNSDRGKSRAHFEHVVTGLSSVSDLRLSRVKSLIQQARAFELRNMNKEATVVYADARTMLRGTHGRIGSSSTAGTASIVKSSLSFVERAYARVGGR